MASWLVKSEPSTYSWQRFVEEKGTRWDGVRNSQARNNLVAMKEGDQVLFYHSGDERAVIGIARVAAPAYPDPTADDPRWLCVDLVPVRALAAPVTLQSIKATPQLKDIALVRQSRLSVMPLEAEAFRAIALLAKAAS